MAADPIPDRSDDYYYEGSLTTPPCSEVATSLVYEDRMTAPKEQIDIFAAIYPHNNCTLQALHRRRILFGHAT